MSRSRKSTSDRTRPPRPDPMRQFRFPEFQVHCLENGLGVYLSRYPRAPLVHQILVLPGGGQQDPVDRAGLSTLTASLMDEGTARRGALEIAHQVEKLGGYLSSQADWDSMSASLGVQAKDGRNGLELLAEIASSASFPPREVERLRSQYLAELKRRQAQPSTLASDALFRNLYGRTIYATPILGTPETVAAIRRPEILETAQREISPDGAALVIVGDLMPDTMFSLVEEAFREWRGQPRLAPVTIDPPPQDDMQVCLIDRPQAPQTELWLGSIGVGRSHPDRAGLAVLNSLLGGKFTSRINLNLRERLGITYGVSTSFSQRRGPGPFVVAASVETDAVDSAVREILAEIRRLQDELVTKEELADTKSYLLGIFPYMLQRIEGLAARLADLAIHDLPRDYFPSYLRQIATVTRDELQILAQKHLYPDKMSVVAVGPRRQIESRLTPFGPLVIDPETGSSKPPQASP